MCTRSVPRKVYCVLGLVVLLAGGCFQSPEKPLGAIANPSSGPGQSGVAFVAGPPATSGKLMRGTELWVIHPDGSAPPLRALRSPGFSGFYDAPAWRPDGTAIAVTSFGEPGTCALWLVTLTGAKPQSTRLASGDELSEPEWSPDGRRLVWMTGLETPGGQDVRERICVAEVSGDRLAQVSYVEAWHALFPHWSPDGKRLTYWEGEVGGIRGSRGLFVVARDGSGLKPVGSLTRTTHSLWCGPQEIIFHTVRRHGPTALVEIWRADVDTGQPVRVCGVDLPGRVAGGDPRPLWTHDRSRVLLLADADPGPRGSPSSARESAGGIYVLDVKAGAARQLTANSEDNYPAWSGDESEVVFVRGGTGLWAVNADGTGERKLVDASQLR